MHIKNMRESGHELILELYEIMKFQKTKYLNTISISLIFCDVIFI